MASFGFFHILKTVCAPQTVQRNNGTEHFERLLSFAYDLDSGFCVIAFIYLSSSSSLALVSLASRGEWAGPRVAFL